ncbi:MAG: hypothetical protein LBU27_02445 [Candidatus Peribacteria bacterium]|jgi:hypothetical protein|nr:hypothetical protein [Candidatus Peribacteria bacterium]
MKNKICFVGNLVCFVFFLLCFISEIFVGEIWRAIVLFLFMVKNGYCIFGDLTKIKSVNSPHRMIRLFILCDLMLFVLFIVEGYVALAIVFFILMGLEGIYAVCIWREDRFLFPDRLYGSKKDNTMFQSSRRRK